MSLNRVYWSWRLTWVRQDGVCLGQKLVTADSLVAFSTPGGEKRGGERQSASQLVLPGNECYCMDVNAGGHKLSPHVLRQMQVSSVLLKVS